MLFKLRQKVGNHVERDEEGSPRIYKAGDVVESKQDLVRLFSGKFDRIDRDDTGTAVRLRPDIPMPSKGVDLEQSASLRQPAEPTKPTESAEPTKPTESAESTD